MFMYVILYLNVRNVLSFWVTNEDENNQWHLLIIFEVACFDTWSESLTNKISWIITTFSSYFSNFSSMYCKVFWKFGELFLLYKSLDNSENLEIYFMNHSIYLLFFLNVTYFYYYLNVIYFHNFYYTNYKIILRIIRYIWFGFFDITYFYYHLNVRYFYYCYYTNHKMILRILRYILPVFLDAINTYIKYAHHWFF